MPISPARLRTYCTAWGEGGNCLKTLTGHGCTAGLAETCLKNIFERTQEYADTAPTRRI